MHTSTHRFVRGLSAISFLSAAIAAPVVLGQTQSGDAGRRGDSSRGVPVQDPARDRQMDSGTFDSEAWKRHAQGSGLQLADAVRLVEQQCNCRAVEVRWSPSPMVGGGMRGDAAKPASGGPAYLVLCVDDAGRTQRAVVDCATRQVSLGAVSGTSSGTAHSIVKSEQIVGSTIYGRDGEKLGEVEDLAIAPESGEIIYALVEYEGGERDGLYAVPWGALPASTGKAGRMVDITRDRIREAPHFNRESWPDMRDRAWGERVDRFYAYSRPEWRGKGEGSSFALFKASEMSGRDVRNPAGEDLGDIEDLAIDPNRGVVEYVVVAHGGFLGFNERLYGVPWRALRHADGACVVDISKDQLKRGGGFDRETWPDMTSDAWNRRMNDTFPRTPNQPGQPTTPPGQPRNSPPGQPASR